MNKVEIEKRGRVAKVHPRLADMLVQRHGYLRRDMQAQQPAGPTPEELAAAQRKAAEAKARKAAEAAAKKAAKKAEAQRKAAEAKGND